jgi:hypothetical protein
VVISWKDALEKAFPDQSLSLTDMTIVVVPYSAVLVEASSGCSTNKLFYKRLFVCLKLGKQTQTVNSSNKFKLRGLFVYVCLDT